MYQLLKFDTRRKHDVKAYPLMVDYQHAMTTMVEDFCGESQTDSSPTEILAEMQKTGAWGQYFEDGHEVVSTYGAVSVHGTDMVRFVLKDEPSGLAIIKEHREYDNDEGYFNVRVVSGMSFAMTTVKEEVAEYLRQFTEDGEFVQSSVVTEQNVEIRCFQNEDNDKLKVTKNTHANTCVIEFDNGFISATWEVAMLEYFVWKGDEKK